MKRVALVGRREPVGEALVRRLAESPQVERCDLLREEESEELTERLNGFDAVVYVPTAGRSGLLDLEHTQAVFDACLAAGVREVTVLSSAAVHEPSHHHPGWVDEERLAPLRHGNRVAASWRRLEALAQESLGQRDDVALTILRPVTVPVTGVVNNPVGRLLTGNLALSLPGHDPSVQLLALDDLAEAVTRVVETGRSGGGIWHVAPEHPVPLRKAIRRAGVRRLPIPRWIQRLFRPDDELAYIRYSWTVSGDRFARDFGFIPKPAHEPFDEWGLDTDYIAAFERTLFRFLHDVYWRIELAGLEHLPREGAAVLTGVHRGFQPWDGVMAVVAVRRATGRTPRFLLHPTLVKLPFLANYMTKLGGVHACRENADRLLARGDLLGIFPEGIRGAFSYYRDAYQLKRFGRDEFVKMALANRAPIVPFVTVGSAEIYPILGKLHWRWWKRWAEWPCLPITPTLGTVPLPSKWHTRFLPPIHVERRYGPEAASDPEVVKALSGEVRQAMKEALEEILSRRKSIFWGSVFHPSR